MPLRGGDHDADARGAEKVLETAFLGALPPSGSSASGPGLLVELIETSPRRVPPGHPRRPGQPAARPHRRRRPLDWGHFEQIGRLVRCGPDAAPATPLMLPAIGEHTVEVLLELGFTAEIDTLIAAEVVRQG